LVKDKVDVNKELKALEREFKLENVKIKEDKEIEKGQKAKKKSKAKEYVGFKGFKKKHKDWFRNKPPRGQKDIPLDEELARHIVGMPFDYWSTSRHPLWKLEEDEETKLAKSFVQAFGPFIPWMIRRYLPIISFTVLFLRTMERKRKAEAQLILQDRLNEFTPKQRKKIMSKLTKKSKG